MIHDGKGSDMGSEKKTRVEQNNKEQVEYLVFVDVLGCVAHAGLSSGYIGCSLTRGTG
jgi:hypothetical protein